MGISLKKKKALCNFHNNRCEECKEQFIIEELEIHKINPELGYSDHRNLKVVCTKCHNIFSSAQRIAEGIQGR